MAIRIGILGTRGIPNNYGGFERLAEQLSRGLVNMGHEVFVYSSHNHLYQQKKWNGVNIIHCYDPEYVIGTSGQFIYDLNCVLDARKQKFDIMLVLGYTSSSIWGWLFPKNTTVIYNMDGMEWKRSKYSKPVQKFLCFAERLAVRFGDYFIADSYPIQNYFKKKYLFNSEYIAYGATLFNSADEDLLNNYSVKKYNYYILVARMEQENNIEMILDGFTLSPTKKQFLVVGYTANKFGKYLCNKYKNDLRIRFIGAIYKEGILHVLRLFSQLYFHGHSTGGTNPSLLEAMASNAFIVAHNNIFNKSVLKNDALYFNTILDIQNIVEYTNREDLDTCMLCNNLVKIKLEYNWQNIILKYERFMTDCLYHKIHERNIYHKRFSWK